MLMALFMVTVMHAKVVKVAAFDSSKEDKKAADVVCKGEHDELTIQAVLDMFEGDTLTNSVLLAQGHYMIDGFHAFEDADRRTALKIGKMVIFNGEEWVNANGNKVD